MKKTTLRQITEIEDATLKRLQWEASILDETLDELLEREDGRRFRIYKSTDGCQALMLKKIYNEVMRFGEFGSRLYTYGK